MKLNPLLDQEFLKELDKTPLKEVYAEIIALNDEDEILETIEGQVTAGTINVDGASSVRRTCTLTIVADELNIHEYYWGLYTKFKLSLGVKNDINNKYPDIIWFKQGTFVISNFTTSQALSNYTINIQGKDKMTLLNGEMGGMITGLTHDFGKVLITNKIGDITEESLLLKNIIIGAVHQFANEPLFNIIVNDLEDEGLELLEYRGDAPFYLLIDESTSETFNISFDGEAKFTDAANPTQKIALKDVPIYNPLFELEQTGVVINYTKLKDDNGKIISVAKMEYGKTAGYRLTPLTFAGDLIMNVGDSVTSMLDKIVQMLGNYEYFYDVDGRFIFQRKKVYFNSSWNNIINNIDEQYVEPSAYSSAISYSFEDGQLVASYQNNPNLANIKNDFVVWGTKKSVTGQELPIHMRYAIDIKPSLFVNYEGIHYTTMTEKEVNKVVEEWYKDKISPSGYEIPQLKIKANLDWRELLYQMALDYREHHDDEDYYIKLANLNYGNYANGKTGYEQYYVDMEGFWRQLYDPEYEGTYEPIFISRKTYEANPSNYKFAKEKYIPCTQDMPYSAATGYYVWIADEDFKFSMQLVKDLTKASYEANFKAEPENYIQYYIIDPKEPYEIIDTLVIEPFHGIDYDELGLGYYKKEADGSFTALQRIQKEDYEKAPRDYWQIKSKELIPCASIESYSSSKTYCNNLGDILVPQPTQEQYELEPNKYFYREYGFAQCQETDEYNSSITYYKKISSSVLDETLYAPIKIINDDIFSETKMQCYTRNSTYDIIPCVKVILEYQKGNYYTKTIDKDTGEIIYSPNLIETLEKELTQEIEKIKTNEDLTNSEKMLQIQIITNHYQILGALDNADSYTEIASLGNLYYEKIYYECCEHRISYNPAINFYQKVDDAYESSGWVKEVSQNPEGLNFWFDFLDGDNELQKFGCHSIGNRPKGVNDNQVKAIYFRETPTVIFVDSEIWNEVDRSKLGYTYLQLPPNFVSLFSISAQGKSAKTAIDDLIYKHACGAESITISVLPIYHLEPNTRIFVRNDESGINGEYILTRYSLNLGTGNNMSISASKAVDRLY